MASDFTFSSPRQTESLQRTMESIGEENEWQKRYVSQPWSRDVYLLRPCSCKKRHPHPRALQVTDEVKKLAEKNKTVTRFSVTGYSLGGLIARYVVG